MIIILLRTVILYICVVFAVRIMGKRQIGQLQPGELVITIMISQVAVIPLQDRSIPLPNALIPIFVLISTEIIISVIEMKSVSFRFLTEGHSVLIIKDGQVDLKQLKRLRLTIEDINSALRKKEIFDISNVNYAFLETDGSITALLKKEFQPYTVGDSGMAFTQNELICTVVRDGKIINEYFDVCQTNEKEITDKLKSRRLELKDVLLMTCDRQGNINIIERK